MTRKFTRHGLEFLLSDYTQVNIRERNLYFESMIVLLARLGIGRSGWRRISGYATIFLAFLLWPFAIVMDSIYTDNRSTIGYFITAQKK